MGLSYASEALANFEVQVLYSAQLRVANLGLADRDAFEDVLTHLAMDPLAESTFVRGAVRAYFDGRLAVSFLVRDDRVLILDVESRS